MVGLVCNAKVSCCFAELSLVEAIDRVHWQFENLFWRLFRNVFDRHSTGGAVDEGWATSGTVQGQGQVHLFVDCEFLHEVDCIDGETVSATLVSDQSLAEHLTCDRFGLISVIDKVDATLEAGFFEVAKSATASQDLRLDDTAATDATGNLLSLFGAEGYIADRDRHLVRVQQCTSLILMKLQSAQGKRTVLQEGSVKEPIREHHFYSYRRL